MRRVDVLTDFPGSPLPPAAIKEVKVKPISITKQMEELKKQDEKLRAQDQAKRIPPRGHLTLSNELNAQQIANVNKAWNEMQEARVESDKRIPDIILPA